MTSKSNEKVIYCSITSYYLFFFWPIIRCTPLISPLVFPFLELMFSSAALHVLPLLLACSLIHSIILALPFYLAYITSTSFVVFNFYWNTLWMLSTWVQLHVLTFGGYTSSRSIMFIESQAWTYDASCFKSLFFTVFESSPCPSSCISTGSISNC